MMLYSERHNHNSGTTPQLLVFCGLCVAASQERLHLAHLAMLGHIMVVAAIAAQTEERPCPRTPCHARALQTICFRDTSSSNDP